MPSAPFRPALRPTVRPVVSDGNVAGLRQPGTGHFVRIGRVSRAILPSLDGAHDLAAVLDAAEAAGASRADGEDALRALVLLGFVEGAGDATHERLVSIEHEEPEVVTLPESRFTCHGSGQCCRTYALGPLDEEDVRRLEALDLAGRFPEAGPGPYVRRNDQDAIYLERREERCVFLQPDALCGIHARFGSEAKPKVCRSYPWNAQLTIAGLRISDQSECSTFGRSVRAGEPLATQLERVLPLFPERLEVHHPLVLLDAAHPCDYGWILALEQKVQPLFSGETGVPGRPGPLEALLATGRRALELARALAQVPLAPGEPDATVARVLGPPLDVPAPAPAPTPAGLAAIRAVGRALEGTIAAKNLTGPVVPGLALVLAELPRCLEGPVLDGRAPAGPLPGEPALTADLLRASLRNAVFAGRLLCEGRLQAGLLRLALIPVLTVVGARLLARERRLPRGGERELSEAHMIASVGLRTPSIQKALAAVEGRAAEVLEAAPGLVRQLSS